MKLFSGAATKDFEEIKKMIVRTPPLAFSSPSDKLTPEDDATNHGLEYVVMQNEKPVPYASRLLSEAERKYAQTEKELLAIPFGRVVKMHHLSPSLSLSFPKPGTCISGHRTIATELV